MTARHREPTTPDQARYRILLVALVAGFLIGFLFLRVLGSGSDENPPGAGATTTTTTTTAPDDGGQGGTSTTTPREGDGSTTTVPGTTPVLG
ncbi:MAG: hypothetical protein ACRDU9_09440, partial [Acidimicrobiia bacterium]